jgi:hypothetical protein
MIARGGLSSVGGPPLVVSQFKKVKELFKGKIAGATNTVRDPHLCECSENKIGLATDLVFWQ